MNTTQFYKLTFCVRRIPRLHLFALLLIGTLSCSSALAADLVRIFLTTGGDDLRGGNDNVHIRLLDEKGKVLLRKDNANQRQAWGGGSSNVVDIPLQGTPVHLVAGIELETTFGGGIGGDNWNLDRLRLLNVAKQTKTLFEASGNPLMRFTGSQRTKRYSFVVNQCAVDADCDNGSFADGKELCVASGAKKLCQAGAKPRCPSGSRLSERDDRCIHDRIDADGDGVEAFPAGNDCDDNDPRRYPGAAEICDAEGRDEDCDPSTPGFRDADGDGHNSSRCVNYY